MAAMSDYLEGALINHIFRGTAYTGPANIHVGLLTAAPTDSTAGTEVSATNTNYARVAVSTAGGTNWAAASGGNGTTSNVNAITFGTPTAPGSGGVNWGSITHFALYDAGTAGNMLFYGALSGAKTVNAGDAAPSFAAGALTVQIDN